MSILFCFLLVHCSNYSTGKQSEHTRFVDEIPQHIQEVKNVSVFPGDAKEANSIKLIPVQTYGETGEPYLAKIMNCIIDDKDRVIIWNLKVNNSTSAFPNRLYVYHADGKFHKQIGGPGKGPGEYGFITRVQARAGKVFVLDYTSQRLNVYTSNDYTLEKSTLVEKWAIRDHEAVRGMNFGGIKTRNDGNHLAIFTDRDSDSARMLVKYLLMDTDGNALNFEPLVFPPSLNVIKNNSPIPSSLLWMPFMGHTITTLADKDALYSAWTQDFLIKKYDAGGIYQSAIYYPVKGAPFNLGDYTENAGYNQRDVMNTLEIVNEELPDSKPVLSDLKVDDENRIWVAVPMGIQSETNEWWVLEETGELLAKVPLPSEQPIYDIKDGYLYSKKTSEETGAEYVVKYRIELTKR